MSPKRQPLGLPVNRSGRQSDPAPPIEKPKRTAEPKKDSGPRKHLSLRVSPSNWRTLRQLALDRETTVQGLLLEALNLLLVDKYGLPPLEPEQDGRKST